MADQLHFPRGRVVGGPARAGPLRRLLDRDVPPALRLGQLSGLRIHPDIHAVGPNVAARVPHIDVTTKVVIPQAVRLSLPATVGFLVQVIKSTSLASVVGFVELTRAGQILNNSLFQPFLVFALVGGFYFLLCFPLSRWSRAMERKLNVGRR